MYRKENVYTSIGGLMLWLLLFVYLLFTGREGRRGGGWRGICLFILLHAQHFYVSARVLILLTVKIDDAWPCVCLCVVVQWVKMSELKRYGEGSIE